MGFAYYYCLKVTFTFLHLHFWALLFDIFVTSSTYLLISMFVLKNSHHDIKISFTVSLHTLFLTKICCFIDCGDVLCPFCLSDASFLVCDSL